MKLGMCYKEGIGGYSVIPLRLWGVIGLAEVSHEILLFLACSIHESLSIVLRIRQVNLCCCFVFASLGLSNLSGGH